MLLAGAIFLFTLVRLSGNPEGWGLAGVPHWAQFWHC